MLLGRWRLVGVGESGKLAVGVAPTAPVGVTLSRAGVPPRLGVLGGCGDALIVEEGRDVKAARAAAGVPSPGVSISLRLRNLARSWS